MRSPRLTVMTVAAMLAMSAATLLGPRLGGAEPLEPLGRLKPPKYVSTQKQAPGPSRPANRLRNESSPYLLLHADNPVDWYPWGDEAIQRARELDRPIFLSVGYSTCYWCHVMEEECFESEAIAELLNASFISIKVDREERPDLDEIYMTATQLIRRSGGWPNSVFLTPDLKPFFAGTYFPEDQFAAILNRLNTAWHNNREELNRSADQIAAAMQRIAISSSGEPELPTSELIDESVSTLKQSYDAEWGGFGSAPKFPSPSNLSLLWSRAQKDAEAKTMVMESLHQMGRGAIYDHVDGGFHRYTVDRNWRIPHFEKMLYDNALLVDLIIDVLKETDDPELGRLAHGTLDFVLETLTLDSGGFKSAIDAQTDGQEGAFYVWTNEELDSVLSAEERELLNPIFGLAEEPNFEEHYYTLYLTDSLEAHAARAGIARKTLVARLAPVLQKLKNHREKRPFPLVDDKVLTDWNGMMIRALARAADYFGEPRYRKAAERAASFVLRNSVSQQGVLQHAFRKTARVDAFLDDYAFLVRGLIALQVHGSARSGEKNWLKEAERLTQELESRLAAPEGGYYLSAERDHLLFQPKNVYDNAIPSANATMALGYLELEEVTGNSDYRGLAEKTISAFGADFKSYPAAARTLALAADIFLARHGQTQAGNAATANSTTTLSPMEALAQSVLTASIQVVKAKTDAEDPWRPFEVKLKLEPGWHVNANPASLDYLIPTELLGDVRQLVYPKGSPFRFAFADQALSVYADVVVITGTARVGSPAITLRYQACDETRCLAPVEKTLEVANEPN